MRTVAALKASHLVSLQGHTHRHVSTWEDCTSDVEHRQDSCMLPYTLGMVCLTETLWQKGPPGAKLHLRQSPGSGMQA